MQQIASIVQSVNSARSYWRPETQSAIGATSTEQSPFIDVELAITGRHSVASWDAVVVVARCAHPGRRFLLRTGPSDLSLKPNDRIRVIDAHVTVPEDLAEPGVGTLGAPSEVFVVT